MTDKQDLAARIAALIAAQERLLDLIREKESGLVRRDGSIPTTWRERWADKNS